MHFAWIRMHTLRRISRFSIPHRVAFTVLSVTVYFYNALSILNVYFMLPDTRLLKHAVQIDIRCFNVCTSTIPFLAVSQMFWTKKSIKITRRFQFKWKCFFFVRFFSFLLVAEKISWSKNENRHCAGKTGNGRSNKKQLYIDRKLVSTDRFNSYVRKRRRGEWHCEIDDCPAFPLAYTKNWPTFLFDKNALATAAPLFHFWDAQFYTKEVVKLRPST